MTTALSKLNETMSHAVVGPPKTDGSWWRFLTKHGPLEKGNGNPLSILILRTPWTIWKGKKIRHWKMNFPGQQVPSILLEISGENNSRKNKEMEPKQNHHPVVDATCDGSKVWFCKEQYCIGTWNVRFMNQGKLEVVKQEMTRVNIDILGISELQLTGMGEFNSEDHRIYYCGQKSLKKNGVDILVNRRVPNALLGCNLKNDKSDLFVSKANHSISW